MEQFRVKQEITEPPLINNNNNSESSKRNSVSSTPVIDLDSSDNDSSTSANRFSNSKKARVSNNENRKKSGDDVVLPAGFLDPLPPKEAAPVPRVANEAVAPSCRNFWKAGDFDEVSDGDWDTASGGMDHVRVHPRFLHSNATSHKWVLGAFAELLDNSLDEFCNGATYVNIDMLRNKKDGNRMLLIEDNGGGMDPDKMRQCMSLGYSLKSKVADTIGQYGNGFKTSSMRLGADVIVFSRCSAKDGKRSTQSIGLLSYTFLRSTGKEDIVVPMLDYVKDGGEWKKIIRSSPGDWNMNAEAVVQWSPFSSEADLLKQFDHMRGQGTRIIIYNLWEDDQGQLELDFDADEEDIQIRGVNRDEKNIQMANKYPNSRHFLTYRHSLRSYASILYLRIPPGFRMILRGKDIQHHNIVNDMMMTTEITYRPQPGADKVSKDSSIVAVVTMGFVKDAKAHIDVQGYNVYHKNRLIKPFWRLWNSTGSDGRGVIGVLEANFVEPAHDKQGFERTIVLSRLETRLIQMQKTYWRTYCHKIGYAPRFSKSSMVEDKEDDYMYETSSKKKKAASKPPVSSFSYKSSANKHQKLGSGNGFGENGNNLRGMYGEGPSTPKFTLLNENIHDDDSSHKEFTPKGFSHSARYTQHPANSEAGQDYSPYGKSMQIVTHTQPRFQSVVGNGGTPDLYQLVEENRRLKEQLERKDEDILAELLGDLERERNRRKALEAQIEEAKEKSEHLSKEQEIAIDTFAEEREMREMEQDALRKKLEEATAAIQELVQRVKQLDLEKIKSHKWSGSKYMS
ncbi:putative histidine kinase/HSP90-like ATPase superfamily, morc, S5 domain 2 [Helianthus annuus]|uniref:Histidine kinase/HSP90-like ATPase n=1 Tax=Helianthus annuus TaxID=4232 RepID=A0A251U955_HELAN|nr:protein MICRORCHIDIA 7 isoform X1 [Helianthus annuus]KAF5796627.1 putative histidine kinase/HSP90-like ATPase [Helianthus annuus]KAJ0548258.1 putative histidine kinase/HSP90-like ATPase superfamily, morc, S5 domain 2 [Helianthus annuus]KAJ0554646.1 putative histidine kinase/HSP90-like ATPase superfamily, morc, S5 domain 2 [Helianthus annuus]KAJ0720208.1 putative histidine kinase/HSP90-like ATPase superfamily, morc, S5 domain 2 [Helianthus annuus]KAJ0723436.1 putative histidine kinase/HSP90-